MKLARFILIIVLFIVAIGWLLSVVAFIGVNHRVKEYKRADKALTSSYIPLTRTCVIVKHPSNKGK